jgi:rfaE bifunctional protein kinase chain/domain
VTAAWLDRVATRPILVVGDAILDEYVIGRAARLSREAPIPVLDFQERRFIPGGAANPAATCAALGAPTRLLSAAGADREAETLRAALESLGIAVFLVADPARPTPLKTRIMAHMGLRFPQQVARVDRLSAQPVGPATEAALLHTLAAQMGDVGAVVFSDYGGGSITPALIAAARETARAHGVLTAADAQGGLDRYAGFDVLKCNADEAAAALGRPLHDDAAFAGAARALYDRLALGRAMALTRGGDGMTIATAGQVVHVRAPQITEVYDTVGAGDTAVAVFTLALLYGAAPAEAAAHANTASGIVVQHVGNYAPGRAELERALRG